MTGNRKTRLAFGLSIRTQQERRRAFFDWGDNASTESQAELSMGNSSHVHPTNHTREIQQGEKGEERGRSEGGKGKRVKEKEKKAETGNDVSGMTEGDIEI